MRSTCPPSEAIHDHECFHILTYSVEQPHIKVHGSKNIHRVSINGPPQESLEIFPIHPLGNLRAERTTHATLHAPGMNAHGSCT